MNPAWGQVAGVITLVLMLVFIGIWLWAWRPRHRPTFNKMARLPMADHNATGAIDEDGQPR
jgi:cytochrome c oxidase cbb3-type subunit IV